MKFTAAALLILSAVAKGEDDATPRLGVEVYDGPKECQDGDLVMAGNFLKMHYTGTIDQNSATGEKGKQFDSSRDRGETFDVQIGVGHVIPGTSLVGNAASVDETFQTRSIQLCISFGRIR